MSIDCVIYILCTLSALEFSFLASLIVRSEVQDNRAHDCFLHPQIGLMKHLILMSFIQQKLHALLRTNLAIGNSAADAAVEVAYISVVADDI